MIKPVMEILDASSLIAFLKKEKGAEAVKALFNKARDEKFSVFIHQINFVEAIQKCLRFFGEELTKQTIATLEGPFFGISNYMDNEIASSITALKTNYHLSMADAIGLSFAKKMEGRFWTADKPLGPIAMKEKINLKLIR